MHRRVPAPRGMTLCWEAKDPDRESLIPVPGRFVHERGSQTLPSGRVSAAGGVTPGLDRSRPPEGCSRSRGGRLRALLRLNCILYIVKEVQRQGNIPLPREYGKMTEGPNAVMRSVLSVGGSRPGKVINEKIHGVADSGFPDRLPTAVDDHVQDQPWATDNCPGSGNSNYYRNEFFSYAHFPPVHNSNSCSVP